MKHLNLLKTFLMAVTVFGFCSLPTTPVHAQLLPPDQPEQDACNALVLCGNSFTTPYSYQGIGTVSDLPSTQCGGGEDNSMWMRLNVNTAGIIVFTISPISVYDDYDFAVLDMTNTTCDNLSSADVIRCNFNNNNPGSNINGVIGLNTTSTLQFVYAGTFGDSYLQEINANPGDVYLIMINNFGNYINGGTSQGFTIDFTGSTATFNQQPAPQMDSILSRCDYRDSLTIQLSENVKCSSIATDGSDFYLTPTGSIQSIHGLGCSGPYGYTDQVRVVFNPPLADGDYTIHAQNGTDNNTLLNLCDDPMPLSAHLDFKVGHPPIPMLSIDSPACKTLTIHLGDTVLCSTIATDGSDFKITGPSTVAINSATAVNCDPNGYTQTVSVQLAQPIAVDGLYYIVAQQGTDGNTMLDSCGTKVDTGTSLSFRVNSYGGLLTAHPDTTMCTGLVTLYTTNLATPPVGGFQYTWTPAAGLSTPNQASTNAVIDTGRHVFVVTTISGPGCYLRDSVVVIGHQQPTAAFSYSVDLGCKGDTVHFINQSTNAESYLWQFGVGGLTDTAFNTEHIYQNAGTYYVKLITRNGNCTDSAIHIITLGHPLSAGFTFSDDTLCAGKTVHFTNTSTATTVDGIPPHYVWHFGQSDSTNTENPTYTFNTPGVYDVTLIVNNGIPCYDTASHAITVDSIAGLTAQINDTSICLGNKVIVHAEYTHGGLTKLTWKFGDTPDSTEGRSPMQHAYDHPGVFPVTITAHYRSCPDTSLAFQVRVRPMPYINIGHDTSLCLDGAPLIITDSVNRNNPAARWIWNTGDTTSFLVVRHPGHYWARVTIDNCSTTDDITVDKDCYFDIPNAFTPNGDGVDDYFMPRRKLSAGVISFEMSVFNRWGEKIFATDNVNGRGWDGRFNGKAQSVGVYVYIIHARYKNGRSETYKGNVTLIR